MKPNGAGISAQEMMDSANHPELLQKVLTMFQLEGIDYLLKYLTTDKVNNVYVCRSKAKDRAVAFGKLKIDLLKFLYGNNEERMKLEIAEAQLQADITRARKLFQEIFHKHDVQSLGLATGEIKLGWERIRKFPFQGMNRYDIKSKLQSNVEDAVKDDALMRENHLNYVRRVELQVSYSTAVLDLEQKDAKQRQTEVIHMVVENMPKEFEGAQNLQKIAMRSPSRC